MKVSSAEHQQMTSRRLSLPELDELGRALRQARRDLYFEDELSDDEIMVFDVFGLDYSDLVPDIDGNAPDRFEEAALDWRWRRVPTGLSKVPRYHETQDIPRVGDRVRRPKSTRPGLVTAFRPHGRRGFTVRVDWGLFESDGPGLAPIPFRSDIAMSQLVLVAGTLATHVVHYSGMRDIPCGVRMDQRLFLSSDDREVTCRDCLADLEQSRGPQRRFGTP